MINSSVYAIENYGIVLSGAIQGSNSPVFPNSVTENILRIHSRELYLGAPVSALGNSTFYMPIAFGDNKAVLYHEGKAYVCGRDFVLKANKFQWLNTEVTLSPGDAISIWGPANSYTANAIEFYLPDLTQTLTEEDEDYADKSTIQIVTAEDDNNRLPYDQPCLFTFLEGSNLFPDTNFTWDSETNKVVFNQDTVTLSSNVFMVYLNKVSTLPYKLGDLFYRTRIPSEEASPDYLNLVAKPKASLIKGSQIFLEGDQYILNKDYTFRYPKLYFPDSGSLNSAIEEGSALDISYFRELFSQDNVSLVSIVKTLTSDPTIHVDGYYPILLESYGYTYYKPTTLFFYSGLYGYGIQYHSRSDTTSGSPVAGVEPEYDIFSTEGQPEIRIYPEARVPFIHPQSGDTLEFISFVDATSKENVIIEYFIVDEDSTEIELTHSPAQGKAIMFWGSVAQFSEFGDFALSGSTITDFPETLETGETREVAVMYFLSTQYASLWKFDEVTASANIPAGDTITLQYPVSDPYKTFIFLQGVKIERNKFAVVGPNNRIRLVGVDVQAGEKLMVIHP